MTDEFTITILRLYETFAGGLLLAYAIYLGAAIRRRDLSGYMWAYALAGTLVLIWGSASPDWPERVVRTTLVSLIIISSVVSFVSLINRRDVTPPRERVAEFYHVVRSQTEARD